MWLLAALLTGWVVPAGAGQFDSSRVYSEKELLEGAVKEGQLLWYAIPLPFNDVVVEEFKKKYPGVMIEVFKAGGTQIIQRFQLEQEKNVAGPDSVSSGLTEAFPDLRRKGYLASLEKLPNWKKRPAWSRDSNASYFYYANFKVGLVYNTKEVKDSEAPKSYAELIDPKWSEKIALFDTTAGFAVPLFRFLIEKVGLGWESVGKLKANKPLLLLNAAQIDETVISGRRAMAIVRDTEVLGAKKKGAPVEFRIAKEGFMLHMMPVAVNARAAHPFAARLFVNWLLSNEAQKRLAQEGYGVALTMGENALQAAGGWHQDPEKIDPEDTKRFIEKLNGALHSP